MPWRSKMPSRSPARMGRDFAVGLQLTVSAWTTRATPLWSGHGAGNAARSPIIVHRNNERPGANRRGRFRSAGFTHGSRSCRSGRWAGVRLDSPDQFDARRTVAEPIRRVKRVIAFSGSETSDVPACVIDLCQIIFRASVTCACSRPWRAATISAGLRQKRT